jgi:hypothetical protein
MRKLYEIECSKFSTFVSDIEIPFSTTPSSSCGRSLNAFHFEGLTQSGQLCCATVALSKRYTSANGSKSAIRIIANMNTRDLSNKNPHLFIRLYI